MPESAAIPAALAAAPVLLILVLMIGLRWSAARAGAAGLAAAAALALGPFAGDAPGGPAAADGPRLFAGVLAEGAFLSLTILWILWPALALHAHQQRAGALDALRAGLGRLTGERPMQVLAVAWFVALFFEGAAGFGTPVALVAPILVGLGLSPVTAVTAALLGHAAGVSFGAIGTPVLAQVGLTGLDPVQLAWRTALIHAVLGGVLMAFLVRALAPADGAGGGTAAPPPAWSAFAAAAFLLPSLAIAALLGPELATLGGALLGGAAFAVALRLRARRAAGSGAAPAYEATPPAPGLARALWPYAVLVALVAVTRALPPVAEALGAVTVRFTLFEAFGAKANPLVHPGTLLLVALWAGAALQRVPARDVLAALADAARRLAPVTVALLAMLCLSRLMLHAGMVATLERAAVDALGGAWPLLAMSLGALGSFVTGSATASNVLFTSLQASTAESLGLPVALLVAAQGAGAAIGNVVCPHNVVAGAATVGLAGRESEVLRRTALPCATYLVLGGLLVAWLASR